MFKKSYKQEELDNILAKTKPRRGWNFSSMKVARQPVPWEYLDIVRLYLRTKDRVLDIGTGGGERFLELSKYFSQGVGVDIDPEMIKVARQNARGHKNVLFKVDSEKLLKTTGKYNAILCRHAPYDLKVIYSRLLDNGYFIKQEVGEKNMLNIKKVLNQYKNRSTVSRSGFIGADFNLVAFMEYNVEYVVQDIESLVFWLQALDMLHSDMEGGKALKNVEVLNKILNDNIDKRGFVTNEHRYLVITQKAKR